MLWKPARKIDAEEIVRVNLGLWQDLVNFTRLVVRCRPGLREHRRSTQKIPRSTSRGAVCFFISD